MSRTLLEDHYDRLTWHKKLAVKFHLSWCWICGRFNKQVIQMQHGIDAFVSNEDKDSVSPAMRMPEDSKERLIHAIRDEQKSHDR